MIIYNSMNNIMEDFGAMFGQKRKAVEIQKFNQYELMLKTEKGKLHSRYIAIICISICVWLIASGSAKDDSFISQLSFASTVTSIILSVIAIILSITGESKTSMMQARMEDIVQNLETTAAQIADISNSTEENMSSLRNGIADLDSKIKNLPDQIGEQFRMGAVSRNKKNQRIEVEWQNNGDE